MGIRRAVLKTDSQVISGHIDKSYKARDLKLEKYLDTVRRIEASFEGFSVKNIWPIYNIPVRATSLQESGSCASRS
jgi:hypothetical protein